MHGKKRAEYKAKFADPKTAKALSQKAEQWHQLVEEIQNRRKHQKLESPETAQDKMTMALLEKALLVNPDPTYLWNHRRECLIRIQDQGRPDIDAPDFLAPELALTQAALERNPKAYGAWMHRKWTLQNLSASAADLNKELGLTALFLKMDERNFHCWNYRRFVVGCLADSLGDKPVGALSGSWAGPPRMGSQLAASAIEEAGAPLPISDMLVKAEWEFTGQKIQDNFSNFSAFYYRSQLLQRMLEISHASWENEIELIENAICTEPDDQTAWWYHALVLDHPLMASVLDEGRVDLTNRLESHLELLRDLLQDTPNNKWILLGVHRVLQVLQILPNEQQDILLTLKRVDPDRSRRYDELMS